MVKRILISVILIMCLASAGCAAAEDTKIGIVDFRKVGQEYKKAKEFNKELEKEDQKFKEEIEAKTQGIRKLRDEIDLLSESAKEKKQPELRKQIASLEDFRRSKVEELISLRDTRAREISEEIVKAVEAYSKKNQYDIVIDQMAAIYSSGRQNITNAIVKELNR